MKEDKVFLLGLLTGICDDDHKLNLILIVFSLKKGLNILAKSIRFV